MKKLLLLGVLIISIMLVSCSSNEKKAQNLIKEHLKETLHDWDSYESVKFSSLDSVYTTVFDNPLYIVYVDKYIEYAKALKKLMKEVESYDGMSSSWAISRQTAALNKAQSSLDSTNYYKPKMEEIELNFKPEFKGWEMEHSFRANNAGGNKVIGHYRYYFDKDITKIVNSEDASEKDKD